MQKIKSWVAVGTGANWGIGRAPVEALLLKVARRSYATTGSLSNLASVAGPDRERIELCIGNAS